MSFILPGCIRAGVDRGKEDYKFIEHDRKMNNETSLLKQSKVYPLMQYKSHPVKMKAVVWENKLRQVSVKSVPKPKITDPLDSIVRITSAAICGSDLHIYNGRVSVAPGLTLGHEIIGVVDEVGEGVEPELLQAGDRVVVWAFIACGKCDNCVRGLTSFCITQETGGLGIPYPIAYNGGQGMFSPFAVTLVLFLSEPLLTLSSAEYVRVPWSTFNCIKVPSGSKNELDYLLLSDIWPTGWYAVTLSEFQPGDSVAVFGAGMFDLNLMDGTTDFHLRRSSWSLSSLLCLAERRFEGLLGRPRQ